MNGQQTRFPFDNPNFWRKTYHSQHDPHWAIAILLDPRGEDLNTDAFLRDLRTEEIPSIELHVERALGMFDQEVIGWVPYWFPKQLIREERTLELTSEERLAWFDSSLARHAHEDWPPKGSLGLQKRAAAIALLRLLAALERGHIPPSEGCLDTSLSTESLKARERQEVRWDDVPEGVQKSLFEVWCEGRELRWAKKCWEALAQRGLTAFSNGIGRTRVLVRLMALGTIYREFCDLACDEGYWPECGTWASELDLNRFRVVQCVGSEFDKDSKCDEEVLFDSAIFELVDQARSEVYEALTAEFGGDSMLLVSLLNTIDYRKDEKEDIWEEDESEEETDKVKGAKEQEAEICSEQHQKEAGEINWLEDAEIILNNPTPERMKAFQWIQEGMPSVR